MSTTPQDPTTLEFLSDDDYSSLPLGPSTVHAGTRLPGGQTATPGAPGAASVAAAGTPSVHPTPTGAAERS
jgi:hypothetical protein